MVDVEDIMYWGKCYIITEFDKINIYLYFSSPFSVRPSVLNLIAQQKSDCNIVLIVAGGC